MTNVIWLGRLAQQTPGTYHTPSNYRTHAENCKWAATAQENQGRDWPVVDAKQIPTDTPRCSYCGGGR